MGCLRAARSLALPTLPSPAARPHLPARPPRPGAQLCAEDYLWWWRSFYRGGSIALYVLVYSVGFLINTLNKCAQGLQGGRAGRLCAVLCCAVHAAGCLAVLAGELAACGGCEVWREAHRWPSLPPRPALPRRLSGILPVVLYLSYMSLCVWCLFLAMGTIGFLASFAFTWGIFNASKVRRGRAGAGC